MTRGNRHTVREWLRRSAALLALALAAACASPGSSGGGSYNSNVITLDELGVVDHKNAYEAIANLRPRWLVGYGPDSLDRGRQSVVQAYLNDIRLGTVEELRSVPIQEVVYIRWYPPAEASGRFGLGHGAGAIVVATH